MAEDRGSYWLSTLVGFIFMLFISPFFPVAGPIAGRTAIPRPMRVPTGPRNAVLLFALALYYGVLRCRGRRRRRGAEGVDGVAPQG